MAASIVTSNKYKKENACPLCGGQIEIQEALCGFKALCKCSPKLWGLGETRAIAREWLFYYMQEKAIKKEAIT